MSLFQSEPSEQPAHYCRILLHKKRSRSCHVRPRSVRLEQEHPLLPIQLLKKEGGKTKTEVNFISCWRNAAPLFALHTCPLFLPAHSLESLRILLLSCFPLVGHSTLLRISPSVSPPSADLAIVLCMAHLEWANERGCYLLRFVRDGLIRSGRTINN